MNMISHLELIGGSYMKEYKPMKVIEFLRNLDENTWIKVSEYYEKTLIEEEYYVGDVFGCPWWIADLYIDTDVNGCGIYVDTDLKANKPYIGIFVRENE